MIEDEMRITIASSIETAKKAAIELVKLGCDVILVESNDNAIVRYTKDDERGSDSWTRHWSGPNGSYESHRSGLKEVIDDITQARAIVKDFR